MADFKVGANGDLSITVAAGGDIVLAFTDNESLTSQSISIALHPQVLGQALVSALGGATWAQSLVGFLLAELANLIPATPAPAPAA